MVLHLLLLLFSWCLLYGLYIMKLALCFRTRNYFVPPFRVSEKVYLVHLLVAKLRNKSNFYIECLLP